MITIPYYRIGGVVYTGPFAFPFAVKLSAITCVKPRVRQVSERNRVLFDFVFTYESRVVL